MVANVSKPNPTSVVIDVSDIVSAMVDRLDNRLLSLSYSEEDLIHLAFRRAQLHRRTSRSVGNVRPLSDKSIRACAYLLSDNADGSADWSLTSGEISDDDREIAATLQEDVVPSLRDRLYYDIGDVRATLTHVTIRYSPGRKIRAALTLALHDGDC